MPIHNRRDAATIKAPRDLVHLWDYGWLNCDEVVIPPCNSVSEVISAYVRSDSFGTSFVGPLPDPMPELHGPFWRKGVAEDDFQLISTSQFAMELRAIRQHEDFGSPVDDTQWQAVEYVTSKLEQHSKWLIALRLTEKHREKFHDWGFVLWLFREFLFANPNSDRLSRCVFGRGSTAADSRLHFSRRQCGRFRL
ncbi:MAG: hypothetical protein ABSH20_13305 [Tepidisphaeraceae bacterium]|jgi:hypothetical protein